MDTDGDGSISGEDLGKVLNQLGICVTEEEIQEMIRVADRTGEGKSPLTVRTFDRRRV